jgi:hypothetical protein
MCFVNVATGTVSSAEMSRMLPVLVSKLVNGESRIQMNQRTLTGYWLILKVVLNAKNPSKRTRDAII